MSRSPPADPTLFTSTTPHASAKPSTVKIGGKAPLNETPQQKVARLREAARRVKQGQESSFDRVVTRGRVWADRAHRFTTVSLIGFTILAAGITVFALGDMMVYNRRRRNEFYRLQREQRAHALELANEAINSGSANEEQLQLVEEEKAKLAGGQTKKQTGLFKRLKEGLVGGLEKEDKKGGTLGIGVDSTAEKGNGELGIVNTVEGLVDSTKEKLSSASGRPVEGGPLDQLGATVAQDAEKARKSWLGWLSGR